MDGINPGIKVKDDSLFISTVGTFPVHTIERKINIKQIQEIENEPTYVVYWEQA